MVPRNRPLSTTAARNRPDDSTSSVHTTYCGSRKDVLVPVVPVVSILLLLADAFLLAVVSILLLVDVLDALVSRASSHSSGAASRRSGVQGVSVSPEQEEEDVVLPLPLRRLVSSCGRPLRLGLVRHHAHLPINQDSRHS